jgi:hypothetical protein
MTKLTRRTIKDFSTYSSEQLRAEFDAIERKPEARVKTGTHVKRSWAKYGDRILAELDRRRELAQLLNLIG